MPWANTNPHFKDTSVKHYLCNSWASCLPNCSQQQHTLSRKYNSVGRIDTIRICHNMTILNIHFSASKINSRSTNYYYPCRLFVCLQHNSKTNDPKVFKLGDLGKWHGFGVERSKVKVRIRVRVTAWVWTLWVPSSSLECRHPTTCLTRTLTALNA